MKRIILSAAALLAFTPLFAKDITLRQGELAAILASENLDGETTLKLTGTIDARDLEALSLIPASIKTIDLSATEIAPLRSSGQKYFGLATFKANEIPHTAFFQSKAESILLPSGVTAIGDGAFSGSAVTAVALPEGLKSIGEYCFYNCENLKTITLPSTLTGIGRGAFGNCPSLAVLSLAATGVTEIPARAFAGDTSLAELSLPAALASVGSEAFEGTALETLSLAGVTNYDPYSLSGMQRLRSVTLNPDATAGEGLLMDNTSLSGVAGMPVLLPDYFAANSSLSPSDLSDTDVAAFGRYAFANTPGETLVLPADLLAVGQGALSGMTYLKEIDARTLDARVPAASDESFEGITPPEITLLVTEESVADWQADPAWGKFLIKGSDEEDDPNKDDPNDDPKDDPNDDPSGGISGADASGISIAFRGNVLVVEADAVITDVRIFTPDGRAALYANPGDTRFQVESAALPSGMIVVAVSDSDGNTRTASLLK